MTTKDKNEIVEYLFQENSDDINKDQSYKDTFKGDGYNLPSKYYLLEMYSKQKELQEFMVGMKRTQPFPVMFENVRQKDVQLAIYHFFCAQVEMEELKVEIEKLHNCKDRILSNNEKCLDADFELIDIFFFLFNVGIYSGIDFDVTLSHFIVKTLSNEVTPKQEYLSFNPESLEYTLKTVNQHIINFIDNLPWKAWKSYDYKNQSSNSLIYHSVIEHYAKALITLILWAQDDLGIQLKDLFNLYMHKWEENKRRQEDKDSGYNLTEEDKQN